MRGCDDRSVSLFSYIDLEKRIRQDHPLRTIRRLVDDALATMDHTFGGLYSALGRPSIAQSVSCGPCSCRRSIPFDPTSSSEKPGGPIGSIGTDSGIPL